VKHLEPSVLRNSISSYSMTRFWIEFLNKFSGAPPLDPGDIWLVIILACVDEISIWETCNDTVFS
jgi:hypothetical protein